MSNRYDCILCDSRDIPYYNLDEHLVFFHRIRNQLIRTIMITPTYKDRANPFYCFKDSKSGVLL